LLFRVGVDIGSVSVNVVVLDGFLSVIEDHYIRHKGKPVHAAVDLLSEMESRYGSAIEFVATTGTGAKAVAPLLGASFTNEIIALTKAFHHLLPNVGSVIDIGGEDSKFLIFETDDRQGKLRIKDFSMNALCAAGTGSFLDQQASRLGFTIEEFGEIALRSENAPRIAGRCTVFAKSDMIHLQQIATPDYDLVAGLCFALARNFKSNIAKGKEIRRPVAFIGGVASNAGMRRAIREVFSLADGEFVVPERHASMGALGAVYAVLDDAGLRRQYTGAAGLRERLVGGGGAEAHEPLSISERNLHVTYAMSRPVEKVRAYLGVDVGALSTNQVVIDEQGRILAKRYLMTGGGRSRRCGEASAR
jgi:predicted CoA-substrate-specific enzyme activase